MRSFSSPGEFATYLRTLLPQILRAETEGLTAAAHIIQHDARERIGHYQLQEGPFAAWRALSEQTLRERRRQGFSADTPLLREGLLRAAIECSVGWPMAAVGVKDAFVHHNYQNIEVNIGEVALTQEFGSRDGHIPPRSFLGAAAHAKGEEAAIAVGYRVFLVLQGLPTPKV